MSQKKRKSLHQQITWVAPEDKHLSNSMAMSDHVALIVETDSIGYKEFVVLIFEKVLYWIACNNNTIPKMEE